MKKNSMKTIEERAKEYADRHKAYERIYNAKITAYERGATEQKAIDIEKARNIFCPPGCRHKTDNDDCFQCHCPIWKQIRRMMEE